eukprot:1184138-Prorocentrum_minimum.AAC.1
MQHARRTNALCVASDSDDNLDNNIRLRIILSEALANHVACQRIFHPRSSSFLQTRDETVEIKEVIMSYYREQELQSRDVP